MPASALGGAAPPPQFASANPARPAAAPSPGRPRTTGDALRPPTWTTPRVRSGLRHRAPAARPPPAQASRLPESTCCANGTDNRSAPGAAGRGAGGGVAEKRRGLGAKRHVLQGTSGFEGVTRSQLWSLARTTSEGPGTPRSTVILVPKGWSNRRRANRFMVDCQEALPPLPLGQPSLPGLGLRVSRPATDA